MTVAFVMINTAPDQREIVLDRVKEIEFVTEAYLLDREYDVVAVIKTDADADFPQTLLRIRTTKGVSSILFLQTIE
jgi:nitrate reductase NapAB chaperone NapD